MSFHTIYKSFLLKLPYLAHIHVEHPSIVQGDRYVDVMLEPDNLTIYFGRLNIVVSKSDRHIHPLVGLGLVIGTPSFWSIKDILDMLP